jgi:CRP/FNR family transcriptional regulator, cyclic AMP receptor protein
MRRAISLRKVLFILGQLTDSDVDRLGKLGNVEDVEAGAELIRQGDHIEKLYIVLSGSFTVTQESGKKTAELALLRTGEIIGEMSFVDAAPTAATVIAAEPSSVLAIPRGELAELIENDPPFAARFYKALAVLLSDRLRQVMSALHGTPAGVGLEEDELDPAVLSTLSLAGERFDRILAGLRDRSR